MNIHIRDDALIADALALLLRSRGHDAIRVSRETVPFESGRPDVVVTDLGPNEGPTTVLALRQSAEATPIAVLTECRNPARLREAMLAGADGIALKREGIQEIERTLVLVADSKHRSSFRNASGHVWSRGARSVIESGDRGRRSHDAVTAKERLVLERLVLGENTAEIARVLGIGEATVRSHLQNLFLKFGVHSRLGLTACALRTGVVRVDPATRVRSAS